MSSFKKSVNNVLKIGVIATLIFMGFWVVQDRTISNIEMVLLSLDVVLLGLIGRVVDVLEKIDDSVNNQEIRK